MCFADEWKEFRDEPGARPEHNRLGTFCLNNPHNRIKIWRCICNPQALRRSRPELPRGLFEFCAANPAVVVRLSDEQHLLKPKLCVDLLADGACLVSVTGNEPEDPRHICLSGCRVADKGEDWESNLFGDLFRQMGGIYLHLWLTGSLRPNS